ncbi:MAG: aminopeptidase N C-terminal domain-containing protein, partial [Candidatus Thioglobus sp.]|nr:aminopeptidase N C-terminal domain-containing protein [Candidatus Thioglobus sp.]
FAPGGIFPAPHSTLRRSAGISLTFAPADSKRFGQNFSADDDENEPFNLTPEAVGKRALRNICLAYLVKSGKTNFADLAFKQFKSASCMSDRLSAFEALLSVENQHQKVVIKSMFERYKNDTQVMDKWFAAQALAAKTTVSDIKKLMQNPLFCFDTPNRLRSVIGSFTQNFAQFHNQNGYQLLTKIILKLNISNPQIGARLLGTYSHWRRFTPELKALQKQQLEIILASKNLSNDIFEITQTALK